MNLAGILLAVVLAVMLLHALLLLLLLLYSVLAAVMLIALVMAAAAVRLIIMLDDRRCIRNRPVIFSLLPVLSRLLQGLIMKLAHHILLVLLQIVLRSGMFHVHLPSVIQSLSNPA
ncbi:hypothetical protein DNH61_14475 [Paenibacillus sambharensis]|uniref:Uncharacterized protein n=1 Tax=Paenibacillus sambharensis TaxID=1803190 RepID=A0A2W1L757_9BACL|nr:hypothetical protein DNH61_14475 [Paenibacillus sambharensis]